VITQGRQYRSVEDTRTAISDMRGRTAGGRMETLLVCPEAREASEAGLPGLFPDRAADLGRKPGEGGNKWQ
jgi:hypothetical protein